MFLKNYVKLREINNQYLLIFLTFYGEFAIRKNYVKSLYFLRKGQISRLFVKLCYQYLWIFFTRFFCHSDFT